MITLHWVFRNGHSWRNDYPTAEETTQAVQYLGLLSDPNVKQVWTEQNGLINWIKTGE